MTRCSGAFRNPLIYVKKKSRGRLSSGTTYEAEVPVTRLLSPRQAVPSRASVYVCSRAHVTRKYTVFRPKVVLHRAAVSRD